MIRIVRFHQYGDPSVLKIEDLDVSPPAADEVQVEVKSIGLNRAEVMFRKSWRERRDSNPRPPA
jgi:NADPH:quinone reductase-like Zn-dependent oxidoreductase